MITLAKVKQIEQVIDKYMGVIDYLVTGDNTPDAELLQSLKIKENEPLVKLFYKYGKTEMLNNISIKSKSTEELYKLMQNTKLSEVDKQTLLYLKINSMNSISNFQSNIKIQIVNEVTKDDIKTVFIKNINTENSEEIANKLADLTNDYVTNWKKIAHTELWNAKIYGQAASIIENSEYGIDTVVYKKVEENACKHCKKHYLNDDGTPKVFTLKGLIKNGTNYGKKTSEWKPVLGTMHPNCMCRLVVAHTDEITPSPNLVKAVNLTTRTVDKTKLRYEKRMVNDHGVIHEQGFWVKDDTKKNSDKGSNPQENNANNAKVADANSQGYSGTPKTPNEPTVGPGKNAGVNISGMNQHNGAQLEQKDLQTIQVTQGDNDIELPKVPFASLPDKRKKYFGAILGFDYGTMLSLDYIYGRKEALAYLENTGFNIKVEDTEQAWNNAWNEISQYLCVSDSPNSTKNYTEKIFDIIHSTSDASNEGDYARVINTVTGGLYPTLGVYDYNNDKVVGIVTQVGDKFYGSKGNSTMTELYSKYLDGKVEPMIPLVPIDLKKDPQNEQKGNWFFNEIRLQSANVKDKDAKEILKKLVKELTGEKSDL